MILSIGEQCPLMVKTIKNQGAIYAMLSIKEHISVMVLTTIIFTTG